MPDNFVWYELMTSDPKAAEDFYKYVVGWSARDAGMPNFPYTLFSAGDELIAGMMALSKEACEAGVRPAWLGYVGVDDVDGFAQRATRAGAKIHHGPEDIPGVGRFAVLADPQGAVFALFKASTPSPSPALMKPGHIGWHELHASDGARAFEFYSGLLGWGKGEAMNMGPIGIYQLFNAGGPAIGGMFTKPPHEPTPHWLYYFSVPAIEDAVARVKEKSGKVTNGPTEVPGGAFIIHGLDPQGAMFALVAPPKSAH
jgi:predicted enzyme related to lactoylglutathione lyase